MNKQAKRETVKFTNRSSSIYFEYGGKTYMIRSACVIGKLEEKIMFSQFDGTSFPESAHGTFVELQLGKHLECDRLAFRFNNEFGFFLMDRSSEHVVSKHIQF